MKTLEEFVAFVDLVLAPDFDVAAAEHRLGPIMSWVGEMARVKDVDPALRDSVIETAGGVFAGIQTNLRTPLMVPWQEVEAILGKAERLQTITGFGAPPTYLFRREAASGCGDVYVKYYGAPTHVLDTKLGIEGITIRPDKALPGVPAVDPGEVRR